MIVTMHYGFIYSRGRFVGLDFGSRRLAHQTKGPDALYRAFGVSAPVDRPPRGLAERRATVTKNIVTGSTQVDGKKCSYLLYDVDNKDFSRIDRTALVNFGLYPSRELSMGWSSGRFGATTQSVYEGALFEIIAQAGRNGTLAFQYVSDSNFDTEHLRIYDISLLPDGIVQEWERETELTYN